MSDQPTSHAQPVVSPAEAWHLAHGQAYERAAMLISRVVHQLSDPCVDAAQAIDELRTQLEDESDTAWSQYLSYGDRPNLHADRADVTVQYDDVRGIPVVQWPVQKESGSWGIVDLETSAGNVVLATPFRAVDTGRLPDTRVLIEITDRHHVAVAALVEVMRVAQRDTASAFQVADGTMAWRRLNAVINVYRQATNVLADVLGPRDFNGLRPSIEQPFEISDAPALITRMAASHRARSALATGLMCKWLQRKADELESAGGARSQQLLAAVAEAASMLNEELAGLNHRLAESAWTYDEPFTTMLLYRDAGENVPVLAVTPWPDESKVKKLPQRRKRS